MLDFRRVLGSILGVGVAGEVGDGPQGTAGKGMLGDGSLRRRNDNGQFFNPSTPRQAWRIGETQTVTFSTIFDSFNIALWQQYRNGGGADLGPILLTTTCATKGCGSEGSFTWVVQAYDFDIEESDTFLLWMFNTTDPTTQGKQGLPSVSSGYFTILPAKATSPDPVKPATTSRTTTTSPRTSSGTSTTSSANTRSSTGQIPGSGAGTSTHQDADPDRSPGVIAGGAGNVNRTSSTGNTSGGAASATGTIGGQPSQPALGDATASGTGANSTTAMALGVTMGVIGGALLAGLVFWLVRRWKKKQQLQQTKAATAYEIDDHRHVAHARETGESPVTEMHATPGTTPVWSLVSFAGQEAC
jgi:hypothetical protein